MPNDQTLPQADSRLLKQSAQSLADAVDGMLWAMQNMPGSSLFQRELVNMKAGLRDVLENNGYTLKVVGGFKTKVVRVRNREQLMAASIARTIISKVATHARDNSM